MHPRDRPDMNRRVDGLAASPIRTARPELPAVVKSSPVSPDAPHKHPLLIPSSREYRTGAGTTNTQHDADIAAYILSLPPNNMDYGYQCATTSPGIQDNVENHTDHRMEDASAPQPPRTRLHRLNTFLRRGTLMSTSTDMTTASLRKALSGKSSGFITQVKRVLRSTMPVRSPDRTSPVTEVYPEADCPMPDSWVHDEQAPDEISCAPPLPGEFLIVDRILEHQAPCLGGLDYVHQTKNCLCRPAEAASASIWVSGTGLSERGARLLQPGAATVADFKEVDVFGNSLMHLLAARDADHAYILELATRDVPCRAKNTAGQTFLHLLDPSWLSDRDGTPLVALLRTFQRDPAFLLARDCYGRTLFHALRSKVDDPAPLARVLRALDVRLSRDAFGVVPSFEVETPAKPLRRAMTSVTNREAAAEAAPIPRSPPLRYESDLVIQKCLLAFVNQCYTESTLEDAQGRNGLHALAAAILSDTSIHLNAQGGGPRSSRKRKREAPGCKNELDSSTNRLELREGLMQELLDAGVNPNAYDGEGNTPLMAFCAQLPEDDDYKVPVSILQRLLDRGADPHARNRRGETALHVAVRRGRKLAVRTLVRAGANVHVRDASGRGVLDVCDDGMAMGGEEGEGGYMLMEACRAWLSGQGRAVQEPGVLGEWAAEE